ncbi:MAG TPA: MerC family mercury resistance protein [Gemmatimonadaceae bacterium]|nr:MerC family mercury resistance protein [Gemmatimonadaceae bacterium]
MPILEDKGTTSAVGGLAGAAASSVALLCCAGAGPALALATALGLGFLIHDAVLIPLLVIALGVTMWGLSDGRGRHGKPWPQHLGTVGAVCTLGGMFVWLPLAYAGLGMIIAASAWNLWLTHRCAAPDRQTI